MADATKARRMIRLPDEVANNNSSKAGSDDARAERALEVEENVALEKLARAIIERKIRPEVLREGVVADLANWLREMLVGPALIWNKRRDFAEDVLNSTDFCADAEIFVETLPGCHPGLIERNRNDETKRKSYPDPDSELRVREDVLRSRCAAMVESYSKKKNVADEALKKKAADDFFGFFRDAIMQGGRPPTYNSYVGMMACMGDMKFMKQSEDIVLLGLGLSKELPAELATSGKAPPPFHTLAVFVLAMYLCVWALPSLDSIDEYATIETFTSSIFEEGPFSLSPATLGFTRLLFAIVCIAVTKAQISNEADVKIVRLPGSKLHGGRIKIWGLRTQGFYTSWAWNMLGLSFFLGGMIPLLVLHGREDILHKNPWMLRTALISFEIAAPSAFLTSFVVTYALWPRAFKQHGSSGTVGFRTWTALFQHNANAAMVLLEVCLMGGLPMMLSHAAFAPIYGGMYQIFLWLFASRWSPKHGPYFPYFFMDTTLGVRTTLFMVVLFAVLGFFFVLFALLDKGMGLIEQSGQGAIPNVFCVIAMSYLLMKFKE